ncbi:MAG: ribonuclease P protein component [Proteobacteria bacterium]|nr:ribonuclease P protein component [Pseudomonadota bacterium]
MYPKSAPSKLGRLKRRREFLAVQRAQKKWATPGMIVQTLQCPSAESPTTMPRIGFTASRKVGNAVARNRVRRRLRACVAGLAPDAISAGVDIVIIARRGTLQRRFSDLEADFRQCLGKLKVLSDASGPNHA